MSQLQQEVSKNKISICFCSRLETYRLDACYGEETKTREIFVAEMDAMIASLCQGLNSTVFALGAIGGGKTHTMKVRILGSLVLVAQKYILLDDGMKESTREFSLDRSAHSSRVGFFSLSQGSREEPGLIPLALEKILAEAEKTSCSKVEVSYYQVYMDRCYNLLDPRVGEVSVFDSSQGGRVRLRGLNRVRFSLEISRSSAVVNPRSFQPKIPKIHILYINSFA